MIPGDESGAATQLNTAEMRRVKQRCIKAAGGGAYDPLSRVGGLSGVCVLFMLL